MLSVTFQTTVGRPNFRWRKWLLCNDCLFSDATHRFWIV